MTFFKKCLSKYHSVTENFAVPVTDVNVKKNSFSAVFYDTVVLGILGDVLSEIVNTLL